MAYVFAMLGGWVPIVPIQSALAGAVKARVPVPIPALVSLGGMDPCVNISVLFQIPAPKLGAMTAIEIVGLVDVQHRQDGVLLERGIPAVRVFRRQVTTADVVRSGPITRQTGGNAIDPNAVKAVTMAHALLLTCVFVEMVGAAQVVALLSVRPRALSKAHVLGQTNAPVELDSWDQPASRLHAKQAVFTGHARFRSDATATRIGLEEIAIKLFRERDVCTE